MQPTPVCQLPDTDTHMRCLTAFTLALLLGAGCGGVKPVHECLDDSHCFEDTGYVCDTDITKMCLRKCQTDSNCLVSQTCDLLTDQTFGVCRQKALDDGGR